MSMLLQRAPNATFTSFAHAHMSMEDTVTHLLVQECLQGLTKEDPEYPGILSVPDTGYIPSVLSILATGYVVSMCRGTTWEDPV